MSRGLFAAKTCRTANRLRESLRRSRLAYAKASANKESCTTGGALLLRTKKGRPPAPPFLHANKPSSLLMKSIVVRQGSAAFSAVACSAASAGASAAASVVPFAPGVLRRVLCRRRRGDGRLLLELRVLRATQGRRGRRGATLVVESIVVQVLGAAHRAVACHVAAAAGTVVRTDVVHHRAGSCCGSRSGNGLIAAGCSALAVSFTSSGKDCRKGKKYDNRRSHVFKF